MDDWGHPHGIPRVTAAEDISEGVRLREQEKINTYRELVRKVQEQRSNHDRSKDALANTTKLLSKNPEFYTIWNIRREILQSQFSSIISASSDESAQCAEIQQLLTSDLAFLFPLLKKSPKCYWIWNHRVWLLEQTTKYLPLSTSLEIWKQELALVGKMLSLDNRNFHGWGYRRKVVAEIERLMGLVKGEGEGEGVKASLAKEEFEYTTKMIGTNLSNFSAWHSRMRTIMRLLNEEKASDEKRREMLDKELDLIHRALIDPYDQSLWFYHQNLMCNFDTSTATTTSDSNQVIAPRLSTDEKITYIENEIEEMTDMLDGAEDCKWIYLALIEARLMLARLQKSGINSEGKRDIQEWLMTVKKLDPLRKMRWEEMEQEN
ncbi:geranylgeranyl transferase type-2 subunit alpha [Ascosphaera apis ARSEF 7405]|uniref:Geranylgeranyl transferase type-2 subunit alpha n=1 Tax=Ascosphaera apis ARSEF 7405 TaxID=392613 RepID=A0A167VJ34_9EURO|nr:geranylgeranyl transferase type-2 subunit alpha [Ascosphaera apis ARSEF 7405]